MCDGHRVTDIGLRATRKQTRTTNLANGLAHSLQTDQICKVLQRTGEHYAVASVLMTLECPEVKFVASWGTVPRFQERPKAERPILFRTIMRPLPVVIEDVQKENLDECEVLDPSLGYYASFPIRIGDKYFGSIIMTSPVSRTYTNLKHYQVLQEAADEIAKLLEEQLQIRP